MIEFCRSHHLRPPKFETRGTGPEHEPLFITDVLIGDEVKATGQGHSKRDSERTAALLALEVMYEAYGLPPEKKEAEGAQRAPAQGGARTRDLESWPIYAGVLAQALSVANARVDAGRRGPDAVDMVRRLTVDLYKGLLEDLGATGEVLAEAAAQEGEADAL
nr:putative dsRNA-binding protein [Deinobacterium chartae]